MSVQDSARSFLGIAKETVKGTAVPPTDYFPVALGKLKPEDHIASLFDEGIRGSSVKQYGLQPGRQFSTYDLGGPVFADMIGYFLAGILGEVVTSGASAPYTHTISLLNSASIGDTQPKSFTITDFYAANVRAWPGQQVEEVTFNFTSDGLLEVDVKMTGWVSSTASTPTPTFSTVIPVPVWQGLVTIGGSSIVNNVSGTITLKRPVKTIFGTSNIKDPFQVFLGPLEVTGKLTFVMEADTELTRYLTNTQPAIVFNWSQGAGAAATQVQFTMTKGAYTAATIERSQEYVEVACTINALANTTDKGTVGYSPIKFVLQNAKPASTYS